MRKGGPIGRTIRKRSGASAGSTMFCQRVLGALQPYSLKFRVRMLDCHKRQILQALLTEISCSIVFLAWALPQTFGSGRMDGFSDFVFLDESLAARLRDISCRRCA